MSAVILIEAGVYQPGKLKRLSGGPHNRKDTALRKKNAAKNKVVSEMRKSVKRCINKKPPRKWAGMSEAQLHTARYRTDVVFRIKHVLRKRVNKLVKRRCGEHTLDWLGISPILFIQWLEVLWEPGMSWDNYGCGEGQWSIDHIRPCASFDLMQADERAKCFHYSNMQPMWHRDNMIKSDKWL